MPAGLPLMLAGVINLAVLFWSTWFATRNPVPVREVLPLMIFAGGNAAWMLGMWVAQ